VLKTFAAQHRTPLRRTKRNRGFFSALRTVRPGLGLRVGMSAGRTLRRSVRHQADAKDCRSLALAVFATFGFVLELLIVEEQLFAGCEHEFRATIDALQSLVLEFH